MTAAEFRKIALSLPEAMEASHVGHADFRVGGRIFATLGYPDEQYGVLILTLDQQQELIGRYPEMFSAVKGAWGRRGSTQVLLKATSRHALEPAMRNAWRKRAPKRVLKQMMIAVLFAGCLVAQARAPERRIENNVLFSERDPKVRIEVPRPAQYVGADRWVLLGMADCELHAFVETGQQQNVQRLYWVQFESYLPTRPELHHRYDSPAHATVGGLDFYVDTSIDTRADKVTPGSDTEHIRALLRAKGYKMPPAMMSVRFVHLLDEQKRKELMIIYSEDLGPTGFTAADLKKGGKARDQWAEIEKGLVERAENKIVIKQTLP